MRVFRRLIAKTCENFGPLSCPPVALAFLLLCFCLPFSACRKQPRAVAPGPVAPRAAAPVSAALGEFQSAEISFGAGNYAQAALGYKAYLGSESALANRDRALFRLGLSYAMPDSSIRDMARAAGYFKQLVELSPQGQYASEARLILALEADVERLQSDVARRAEQVRQLSGELEKIKEIDLQRRPARPAR